jgi:hypothetical protein
VNDDLAGYRNGQVYIRRSMHVPLNCDAVRDAMPAFFELLREETEPSVRVVLGHFEDRLSDPRLPAAARKTAFGAGSARRQYAVWRATTYQ